MGAGAVLSSLDERCPELTACSSVPVANMCILLLVLYWKHSEVSKTVWMMSVSITKLIFQAKTWEEIQTGSGKSEVGRFSTQPLLNTQWDMDKVALPMARCHSSSETWMRILLCCEAGWELFESVVWQRARSWSCAFHTIVTCVPWLLYRHRNSPVGILLKFYVKNILKIDSIHR